MSNLIKGFQGLLRSPALFYCVIRSSVGCHNASFEAKYSNAQKEKILKVFNDPDVDLLLRFNVSKGRHKKFCQWRKDNGLITSISDIELIEGFSEKTLTKLFDNIMNDSHKAVQSVKSKIKGQILYPYLHEATIEACKSVLALYVAVNCVCWVLIDRRNYEIVEWMYHNIDYSEGKKLQITDILDKAWHITNKLPNADIYVMKAEATTLRASGSDPNNPKVLAINLQKAQMVSMMVTLINAKKEYLVKSPLHKEQNEAADDLIHKVYFLRPSLPYRLYGTLVGNEKVSTEQTVDMLLQDFTERSPNNSHAYIPEKLKAMFQSRKDLEKDMLGHSLLLALTFMDLCIYKNQDRIDKLLKRAE